MTRCRCIEEFEIPKVDGDGFETGQHALVEADSLWILDEKTNYIGGQNHLECEDFLQRQVRGGKTLTTARSVR